MAITVKHKFVSAIPDAGDTTIVQPSNWNDDHDLVGTVPVANGGTGVTSSSGANSVVLRDANGNITTNCLFEGFSSQAASVTTIVLTASSVQNWQITGSGGQTIKLPNATTLPNGALFTFNNNQSSGTIIVQNNSSTTVATINSGGYVTVFLLDNSIAAGSWDRHDSTPSNVSWSTNTLDYAGSITSATWNGNTIAYNRGGTGQSSAFTAGGVVYGATTSALAVTPIGTTGQVLTSAGAGTPTWTTPTTGTVTSVTGTSPVVSSGGATPAISLATSYGDTLNPYASKTLKYFLAAPNAADGVPTFRAMVATDVPTLNQNTTGSAATLTTSRAIYGNNFDGSAALTQIIASTYGGTGNGFTKFSGATTAEKTYTLPDANATLLYAGGALGTPSSGTVTNLTGTASININGTVGATTATTGAFTTLSASGVITSTLATGTAPFTVASTTQVANLNAATAGTAGNVTGIVLGANGGTGVANTGLTITLGGNLTTSGAFATTLTSTATTAVTLPAGATASSNNLLSSATAVGIVTGTPSSTTYLRGDGTWASVSGGGSVGGSNTQIQYNNAGAFGGVPLLTYNGTTLAMTGSTIDNTVIGGTTPAAGTFNTLIGGRSSTTYVTITGDASYPMIQATGGTNTPLVLSPLGTGALQAQKTDSTATGGNARGANAIDWQTNRSAATQVASGLSSTISGGYSNSAAGYFNFIGGGYTNSGTSGTAVTTQATTIAVTAGTTLYLSSTNANIKIGQYITGTGISANTYATNTVTTGTAAVMNTSTISGTTLTVGSLASGTIIAGMVLTGTGVTAGTYIVSGSGSSWTVSTSQSVASTTITGRAYTFTISQAATTAAGVTLSFYTPHGVVVGGGNNQATGSYSFIGGGGDAGTAANRNVASGDWSVIGGGQLNSTTTSYSFIGGGSGNSISSLGIYATIAGGQSNTASGNSSFIGGGVSNQATNSYSLVSGGTNNIASGQVSTVVGGAYGTTRNISAYFAFPAYYPLDLVKGSSQAGLLVIAAVTTNATATVLTSDGFGVSTTNQVILPNNSAYLFKATVISGVTGGGNTSAWKLEGAIKRGAGVGTTAIVGSVTTTLLAQDAGASTWAITATADTTNGGLKITFTGQAGTTIRTVCKVETTEMTY